LKVCGQLVDVNCWRVDLRCHFKTYARQSVAPVLTSVAEMLPILQGICKDFFSLLAPVWKARASN
jgi:hypothetical protein